MQNTTEFETHLQHIHTTMQIRNQRGEEISFSAIVDTGAPFTELSDRSLVRVGFQTPQRSVRPKKFQETQRYSKIRLPWVNTLGQNLENWVVYVSRFDEIWHVDALVGLDFFRRFRTTIDYGAGQILTEPL